MNIGFFTTITLLLTLMGFINTSLSREHIIYGKNNLIDYYQIKETYPEIKEWSRSISAMVSKEALQKVGPSYIVKKSNHDPDELPFCQPMTSLEKDFSLRQKLSECTAFLIGPGILATARHCVEEESICQENLWVFDFKLEKKDHAFKTFHENNVFECERILSEEHSILDYAIIKLKTIPPKRKPMKIRPFKAEDISGHPNLLVMGHPLGHPLKISPQSTLRKSSHPLFFQFESDTFKGNSGSPVINLDRGVVEGILCSGERDFIYKDHCKKIKYCDPGSCRGERAIKINQIPQIYKWIQ
ncbi:MAG: serine protease [Bdellovibrionota bacterium]|nr:serine protease [Bdellovibrionota bacterium]